MCHPVRTDTEVVHARNSRGDSSLIMSNLPKIHFQKSSSDRGLLRARDPLANNFPRSFF